MDENKAEATAAWEPRMGRPAKDFVTKMVGQVTGQAQFLTGPDRYQLERLDEAGRPVAFWVDANRVVHPDTA